MQAQIMAVGIILIVLVVAFIVWQAIRNTPEHKGKEGEMHVHNILAQLPEDYTILDDVMLKTGKSTLVLRHGRYGNFYGCSNYPRCRFTTQ